jgi:hypothetical protein
VVPEKRAERRAAAVRTAPRRVASEAYRTAA